MRKGFTLLELLVIIAIIGVMTTVVVLSISQGKSAARLKGSVRDVFATVRLARSTALVTQQPCIVTFTTKATEDESQSNIQISSANRRKSVDGLRARSLDGDWIVLGEADPSAEAAEAQETGRGTNDFYFQPVAEEVMKDICIKVVMDSDDEVDLGGGEVNEAKRSMISTFSNVDFLLGAYQKERERKAKAEQEQAAKEAENEPSAIKSLAMSENEERSVVWQVNGRCDPHRIYVYPHGSNPADGWEIRVDRFGSAKVCGEDGED